MKLYVGNLPWSVKDDGLKELFSSYGQIKEVVLIKDKFSGRSKGFGFVTFASEEDAKKAISEMNGKEVEGRPLTVSEARPMVPRDNAPREESAEETAAPMANPEEINSSVEEDMAPEIEKEETPEEAEEIETVEEAKEDAAEDEPATEDAPEAEETTEEAAEEATEATEESKE